MKPIAFSALGAGLALLLAQASFAYTGQNLAAGAKVGLDQARAIALKARPGTIADQELEKEKGGSGLRWSFDIASAGKTYEVGVDAATGQVLENGAETAQAEAAEARADAKAHR